MSSNLVLVEIHPFHPTGILETWSFYIVIVGRENKDQSFWIFVSEKMNEHVGSPQKRNEHTIIDLVISEFGKDDLKQMQ